MPKTAQPPARQRRNAPARKPKRPPKPTTQQALGRAELSKGATLAAGLSEGKPTKVVESVALMQAACLALRDKGASIAFVPTMGALHEGHLQLMREARQRADVVVASIFVNPTQFGPNEDFDAYPRDRRGDLVKCQSAGVDLLFMPAPADMYPEGFQTSVSLGPVTQGLCGRFRPGHFMGVATVVLKLLNIVGPHAALFGEKDWQQLQVIRRMARDLNLNVDIVGCPTVREDDGLAMSSRNKNLTARDRELAPVLLRAITKAQQAWEAGSRDPGALCQVVINEVKGARGVKLQYVEVVDAFSLQPVRTVDRPARVLVAAHLGTVRLIDNGHLGPAA